MNVKAQRLPALQRGPYERLRDYERAGAGLDYTGWYRSPSLRRSSVSVSKTCHAMRTHWISSRLIRFRSAGSESGVRRTASRMLRSSDRSMDIVRLLGRWRLVTLAGAGSRKEAPCCTEGAIV